MPHPLARYATVHWLRFAEVMMPGRIAAGAHPEGSLGWMLGSDGAVNAEGGRDPSSIWGGVALYPDLETASTALDARARFMPFLATSVESWHALLVPVMHHGACNFICAAEPGLIFEPVSLDPGGPPLVITSAGFVLGPDFVRQRAVDFRHAVDRIRRSLDSAPGNVGAQVFSPPMPGADGITTSIWNDDGSMMKAVYQRGVHRTEMDRHKREPMADRVSFTRLRVVRAVGTWEGECPYERARREHSKASTSSINDPAHSTSTG